MATEAYEKVLVMVDKTVNSAGELLRQLHPRSPQQSQNDENGKQNSTNNQNEDLVMPLVPTVDGGPAQTSRRHSDRMPSLTKVKCSDELSDSGEKDAERGDVTIVHAENVFITCDSDSVSVSTTDKSTCSLKHSKGLCRRAHVDGSSEALVRKPIKKHKTVPLTTAKFKADSVLPKRKGSTDSNKKQPPGNQIRPVKQPTSMKSSSSSRSSSKYRNALRPKPAIPKTEPLLERQGSEIAKSKSYSSKSSRKSAKHTSSSSSRQGIEPKRSQPQAAATTRTVSMSCSSRSASSRTMKSPATAMINVKGFQCRGLCKFPHTLTILGPTAKECNESSSKKKKLHPRDPYRPPKKSSKMAMPRKQTILKTTSSLRTTLDYNKERQPLGLLQPSKKSSAATAPKKQYIHGTPASSKKSMNSNVRPQPRDPYRPPKRSSSTTILKQPAVHKTTTSLRRTVEYNKKLHSQSRPQQPRKSSTSTISEKHSIHGTKAPSGTGRPQPRDPYRPPKRSTSTILKSKPSEKETPSLRASIQCYEKLQPRDPYRPPGQSVTTAIPRKQSIQRTKSSSTSSAKFSKRPQPLDPYRPTKKSSKTIIPAKPACHGKPRKSTASSKSSSLKAAAVKKKAYSSEVQQASTKPKKLAESSSRSDSSSKRKLPSARAKPVVSSSRNIPIRTSTKVKSTIEPPSQSESSSMRSVRTAVGNQEVSSLTDVPEKASQANTKNEKPPSESDSSMRTALADDSNAPVVLASRKIPVRKSSTPSVTKPAGTPISRSLRLGKSTTRLETKSTKKKKKKAKKKVHDKTTSTPVSYLELSNRYAVAGRKIRKHADKETKEQKIAHAREQIQESKRTLRKLLKQPDDDVSTTSASSSPMVESEFVHVDIEKLGKPYPRLDTPSSLRKEKKRKQSKKQLTAKKSTSYLDLSIKQYAVAGRRVKKTAEADSAKAPKASAKPKNLPEPSSQSDSSSKGSTPANDKPVASSSKKAQKRKSTKMKKEVEPSSQSDSSPKRRATRGGDKPAAASSSRKVQKKKSTKLKKETEPASQSDSSSKRRAPRAGNKTPTSSSKKVQKRKSAKLKKAPELVEPLSESEPTSVTADSDNSISPASVSKAAAAKPSKRTKLVFTPVSRSPRLGRATTRLETKSSSRKKKKSKKKPQQTKKPESYLDLLNRYAIAGRKLQKPRDKETKKEKISRAREHIQESKEAMRKLAKHPVRSSSTPSESSTVHMDSSASSVMVEPVFEQVDVEKLGRSYPRTETQLSLKKSMKRKQAEKRRSLHKTSSYLDLSLKQYAVAGRRVKKTDETSTSTKTASSGKAKASEKPKTDSSSLKTTKKAVPSAATESSGRDLHTARTASRKSISIPIHRSTASLISSRHSTPSLISNRCSSIPGDRSGNTVTATSAPRTLLTAKKKTLSSASTESNGPSLNAAPTTSKKSISIPIHRSTASLISSRRSTALRDRSSGNMVTASSAPPTQSSTCSRKRCMKSMKSRRSPYCKRCSKCDASMTTSSFNRSNRKLTDSPISTTYEEKTNAEDVFTYLSFPVTNTSRLSSPTIDQRLYTPPPGRGPEHYNSSQPCAKKKDGSSTSVELPDTNVPIYTLPTYTDCPGATGGTPCSKPLDINFDATLQMKDIDTNIEHTLLISGRFVDKNLTELILNRKHCRW